MWTLDGEEKRKRKMSKMLDVDGEEEEETGARM